MLPERHGDSSLCDEGVYMLRSAATGRAFAASKCANSPARAPFWLHVHFLLRRNIPFHKLTNKITKNMHIVNLLSKDLAIDSRRLRPMPIYIDWDNTCRFTQSVPEDGLYSYLQAALSDGMRGIKS